MAAAIHGSRMGLVRTDRKLVLTVLLAALLMEILAFQSLATVPLDIGYPPGTSEWIKLLGWPGIIIYYPALVLDNWLEPLVPLILSLCVLGYLDSLILIALVIFLWRLGRRVISRNDPTGPMA
jgi:hypothetical protein